MTKDAIHRITDCFLSSELHIVSDHCFVMEHLIRPGLERCPRVPHRCGCVIQVARMDRRASKVASNRIEQQLAPHPRNRMLDPKLLCEIASDRCGLMLERTHLGRCQRIRVCG